MIPDGGAIDKNDVNHRCALRKENNMIVIRADANPNIGMGHTAIENIRTLEH